MKFPKLTVFLIAGLASCSPALAQQHDGARLIQQLEKADANRDGAVSKAEFTARRAGQFARMDRNKDGFFTASDVPRRAKNRLPDGFSPDQIAQQFDKDSDGKVSRDEFVNGPALAFAKVDADGDGIATAAEFETARAALAARTNT